jgi:hypothetical protein
MKIGVQPINKTAAIETRRFIVAVLYKVSAKIHPESARKGLYYTFYPSLQNSFINCNKHICML